MNSFLFSSFVPIIGTVQSSNSINYLSTVRPSDRRVEGKLAREYQGPPWRATGTEVPRARKKKRTAGGGSTRVDKKAGKKYFGGSEGAGEKKKSFRRERKKILASTRTQPTKRLTYCKEDFFLPILLRSIYHTGRSCNHRFFLKVYTKENK